MAAILLKDGDSDDTTLDPAALLRHSRFHHQTERESQWMTFLPLVQASSNPSSSASSGSRRRSANIASDIKDVYAEAKGQGYDTKVLRKVISLRKKEPHERQEEEALLETYLNALGMA